MPLIYKNSDGIVHENTIIVKRWIYILKKYISFNPRCSSHLFAFSSIHLVEFAFQESHSADKCSLLVARNRGQQIIGGKRRKGKDGRSVFPFIPAKEVQFWCLRTSDSVFFFFFLLFYSPQETAGSLKSAECIAKVPLRHPVKYSRLDCSSISPSSFPPCPLEPVEHLAVHKIASKPLESAGIDAKTWPRVSRSCPMMGFHAILSFILRDRATLNSREMKRSTYRFSIIERN